MPRKGLLNNMNIIDKTITFLKEVNLEMRKVNWPNRQEVIRYTLIVLGISFAVALFLGSLDILFTFLLEKFIL